MDDLVIETEGLTRYYGARRAVDSLDLRVPRGCVFGFLGRNGAGKTTTIRMLMGLERPTRGSARVLGVDASRWTPGLRARVGYLAEGHFAYDGMSVAEAERFQAGSYAGRRWNRKLFDAVTQHFRLTPALRVREMSRGQRAGLCLALTLAPEPELLVLDDPALGLDPVARYSLLQAMLFATRQTGQTILFSSHLLADVERVADRIAVMDAGVLRADCAVDTFRERVRRVALRFATDAAVPLGMPSIPGLLSSARFGRDLIVTLVQQPGGATERAIRALGATEVDDEALPLETAFVEYVSGPEQAGSLLTMPGYSAAGSDVEPSDASPVTSQGGMRR